MDILNKWAAKFTKKEETPEERYERERRREKMRTLCASQRESLLQDLTAKYTEAMSVVEKEDESSDQSARKGKEATIHGKPLNDELPEITALCDAVERCCVHGLRRVEGEVDTTVKFFGLLKWTCTRLQATHYHLLKSGMDTSGSAYNADKKARELATSNFGPQLSRETRGFVGAIRTTASLSNVQLDEGKTRAFIRQALNMHILESALHHVASADNEDLLNAYYTEFAFMKQKEDVAVMLSLLSGLDSLNFGFMVNDPRLDKAPESMPFSQPLPPPSTLLAEPEASPLVNPDDLLEGKVRLTRADEQVDVVAKKLVNNRHLGQKYDNKEGGNLLADLLRSQRTSDLIDDAANAVLRFLEIGQPEYDIFGVTLTNIVCNPYLCGLARFETAMGVPDLAEACICYLHRKLSTPGLFQVHLSSEHIVDLRDAIEEIGGFHKNMAIDPHEVASILFQFLWELPEPLLTEDRWEAFVACTQIEDEGQRVKNLKMLINDLPWAHKPLVERLLHMLARAIQPEFAQRSGVDVDTIALLLSPILLRSKRLFKFSELDDPSFRRFPIAGNGPLRERLRAEIARAYNINGDNNGDAGDSRTLRQAQLQAEQGAKVIKWLILHQSEVLSDFRDELAKRRKLLQLKVERLEKIRGKQSQPVDLSNPRHVELLKKLWDGLLRPGESEADEGLTELPVEREEDMYLPSADGTPPQINVQALLKSRRWKTSGWHTEDPMGGFRGGGLLSLELISYFVHEYKDKARAMMQRNALPGGSRYPFPVAAINVMRMLTKLLMVDIPESSPSSRLLLHSESGVDTVLEMKAAEAASRTPFWRILNDPKAMEKLFCMAFMILDLHWTRSGATQMGFLPVLDATRRQMGWLLERGYKNVDDLWVAWMKVREHGGKLENSEDSDNLKGTSRRGGSGFHISDPVAMDDLTEQMKKHLEIQDEESRSYRFWQQKVGDNSGGSGLSGAGDMNDRETAHMSKSSFPGQSSEFTTIPIYGDDEAPVEKGQSDNSERFEGDKETNAPVAA